MASSLRASSSLARQIVRRAATGKPTAALSLALPHRTQSQPHHQQTRPFSHPALAAPVLYSAHACVIGARTGHVQGDDLNIDLTMAKALGGAGDRGKTNPEELFAAGYGACFQSAMNASAASLGIKMPSAKKDSIMETTVHLVGDMKKLDMGLRVEMKVKVKGLKRGDLEKVVKRAEEVCPYSRATRGNVDTKVEIVDFEGGSGGGGKMLHIDAEPLSEFKDGTKSYGTSTYG